VETDESNTYPTSLIISSQRRRVLRNGFLPLRLPELNLSIARFRLVITELINLFKHTIGKSGKNPQRKTQQTKPITTAQVRLTSKQALVTIHLSHTDWQTDGHIRFNRRSAGTGPRNACVIMEKRTFLKQNNNNLRNEKFLTLWWH
jgi:hypothetical protein